MIAKNHISTFYIRIHFRDFHFQSSGSSKYKKMRKRGFNAIFTFFRNILFKFSNVNFNGSEYF